MPMSDGKHIRVRRWPLATLFVLAAAALAAAGYGVYRQQARAIEAERYGDLKAIGDLKTGQIVAWRAERLTDVRFNAAGPFLREAIIDWTRHLDGDKLKGRIAATLEMFRDLEQYENAILATIDGRLLLSLRPELTELEPEAANLAVQAVAACEAIFGDFFTCTKSDQIHLDVAAPILGETGQPVAVLLLRRDPANLLYPLIQSWPTPSRTAETLLLRREGDDVLFLNVLRHRPDPALTLRIPMSRTEVWAVQAALGKTGQFLGLDYRGVEVLADLRPIPDSPWFMVAKVDTSEILSELRYRGVMLLFLVVVAILATGGLTAFLGSYRSRKLYRALYRAEREQRRSQEESRAILYSIGDGVIATNAQGRVSRQNPVADSLTGWTEAEALGRPLHEVFHIINEETRAKVESPVDRVLREGVVVGLANHTLLVARDGSERPIADSGAPIHDEQGAINGVVLVFRDQSASRAAEKALRASEARYRRLFEAARDGILILDGDTGQVVDVNPFLTELLGYDHAAFLGKGLWEIGPFKDIAASKAAFLELQNKGYIRYEDLPLETADGRTIAVEFVSNRYQAGADTIFQCNIRDITARHLAEQERENLQAQLLQAQKMESVGRLAGGVAHDFNNMLGVIIGYAQMALDQVDPSLPLHHDLNEILAAAQRSTDLTRQLLAFARRQTISPKVLDLNDTIGSMIKMLQRLIGEDIDLVWKPAPGLWPIKIDPAQVDQILANLSVNARDAIAGVGTLTIETENVVLDETYCSNHAGFVPGQFVQMALSDTGAGMDKSVIEHLFEPFFTTKETGKGTGLGLATVYGIVKQNDGFINVYSEPGHGTVFKVYLPRAREAFAKAFAPERRKPAQGDETLLMVEDERAILEVGKAILEQYGYTVLAAPTPTQALDLAAQHDGPIHMLITDVVMPEMNGKDLNEQIMALRPGIKTLYMSGYTANVIAHRGVIDEGINFLQKPFSIHTLAAKVREVLDQP
jgi:PAS domain S-box-containing protein